MVRNFVLFLFGLWCLCGKTKADCIADMLTGESDILRCATDLKQSLQSVDPNNFCTDDVRKHMTCLIGHVEQCPALTKDSAMLGKVMTLVRYLEAVCTRTKACPGLKTCLEELTFTPELQPNSTPFSLLPTVVLSVCRYFKHQLACLDAHRAACPAEVKATEDMISASLQNDYMAKLLNIDLDKVKGIIADQCPSIPAEFPTNKCVREKLEGIGFLKCIGLVEKLSKEAPKGEQCRFYFDGKACIEDHIGRPCGQENAKVIIDTAPLVIHDLPQNCEKPTTVGIKYSTDTYSTDNQKYSTDKYMDSTTTKPLDQGNSSGIHAYSTDTYSTDNQKYSTDKYMDSTTTKPLDQGNSSGIHADDLADGNKNHGNIVSAPIILSTVLLCLVASFVQMF